LLEVEWGIGYSGVYSPRKVFESYAWQHAVYAQMKDAAQSVGSQWDTVINNYFALDEFPVGDGAGDYLFFIGRLIPLKGLQVVRDVQERTGLPVIVAGTGDESLLPKNCEYLGNVLPEKRSELMGNARAVLVPTLYVEPFGGVNVEAQLTGTPVITTDWGAFTETVEQGRTGFRCRSLDDFTEATEKVLDLDREYIAQRARSRWDMNVLKHDYDRYFKYLQQHKGVN
jgi:glycosyltransferase involved in cell wall biosynthesis